MASSHSAVRKALRGLEDGLLVFTQQLAAETAELRRNVENRPRTGATYYRNILEDLQQRAEGLGQELAALEAVSTEAVSLEELVGHSVALYCQNHRQVQELEAQLAQYGYRDLFAPLPPENPLDMLELAGGHAGAAGAGAGLASDEGDEGSEAELYAGGHPEDAAFCADGAAHEDALGEVTNRLAGAHLGAAPGAACDAASPPPAAQRWAGGAAGAGGVPRTTLKAMAPMTAAKALMRADTPSSLASPEAMSPSMRELLGKYAASSSSGGTHLRASTVPGSVGGGTPLPDRAGQATPPVPAYLSPAFQLAAMEQEVQMAHAEADAAAQGGAGGTPDAAAAPGWQADDAMYSALTATARKLAGKPSFMDAYRQKFPAIMASTERLLQTVEKQRRPAAAAAVAQEEAAAGPVAALALAAAAAAGCEVAGPPPAAAPVQQQVQQSLAFDRWHSADAEESTLDLMAQVIHSRPAAREEREEFMPSATYAAGSSQLAAAAAPTEPASPPPRPAAEQQPPSTAVLLSRALGGTAAAGADGSGQAASSLRTEHLPLAAGAAPGLQSAPRSERSKPQLEQAIAAALGRSTTAVPAAATTAAAAPTPAAPAAALAASTAPPSSRPAAAAAAPVPAALTAAVPPQPAAPASVLRSAACPPLPPAAPAVHAVTAPAPSAQAAVPPLRPVGEGEYAALPTFIRSGLPLETLNAALAAVHTMVQERGSNGFVMEDVEASGLAGAKHKVVVNSLVKLGRVQLHVARGGQGSTLYLLV
ncbi:hypothetical protein ABPG75_009897 [Micractinium tetrahymenae]